MEVGEVNSFQMAKIRLGGEIQQNRLEHICGRKRRSRCREPKCFWTLPGCICDSVQVNYNSSCGSQALEELRSARIMRPDDRVSPEVFGRVALTLVYTVSREN